MINQPSDETIEWVFARIDKVELFYGIFRLNAKMLGLVLSILLGLSIFTMTKWLIIKRVDPVGLHLGLLSQFFIGYRVSFPGSIIGFAYGFALGTLSGTLIGWIYNFIVDFRNRGK